MGLLSGYVLDFFRARVTSEDFAEAAVRRVVICGEGMEAVARRVFPEAEVLEIAAFATLRALRQARVDAAVIEMRGGERGPRRRALLSGARHLLLVPSPDYVYRLGIGRGFWAFAWAVADRFLLAPVALLWLGVLSLGMAASGLMRRARREPE